MAIRTKAYRDTSTNEVLRGVIVNEKNVDEIVGWINRNGGAATGRGERVYEGRRRPARVRLKQRNFGKNWGKRDWRVAALGDLVIKIDFKKDERYEGSPAGSEFVRIKFDKIEQHFVAA